MRRRRFLLSINNISNRDTRINSSNNRNRNLILNRPGSSMVPHRALLRGSRVMLSLTLRKGILSNNKHNDRRRLNRPSLLRVLTHWSIDPLGPPHRGNKDLRPTSSTNNNNSISKANLTPTPRPRLIRPMPHPQLNSPLQARQLPPGITDRRAPEPSRPQGRGIIHWVWVGAGWRGGSRRWSILISCLRGLKVRGRGGAIRGIARRGRSCGRCTSESAGTLGGAIRVGR